MEIFVCNECKRTTKENYETFCNAYLLDVAVALGIDSLQKIVITGDAYEEYEQAIRTHSFQIDKSTNITRGAAGEGFAISIHGVDGDGILQQMLFFRESIIFAALVSLLIDKDGAQNTSMPESISPIKMCLHELGHVLDYQQIYRKYRYTAPDRQFMLPRELEEYITHDSMHLWSEYYAERFAVKCSKALGLEQNDQRNVLDGAYDLLKKSQYPMRLDQQANHAYRILYCYAICIANLHEQGEMHLIEDSRLIYFPQGYAEIFVQLGDVLNDLYQKDTWDFYGDQLQLALPLSNMLTLEQGLYL